MKKTGFWLKDYCQKVLPAKFREGQKEYYGKKGMSLHVDILFLKENGELVKRVYFTSVYRCDQSLVDSLCLSSVVLNKMKSDLPGLEQLYAKSDNASSYHGNFYAEALHQLCCEIQLELKRYDYNEPCRGKDQCDRESAGAKCVMRSYVDAGNDLLTAEDVYQALHYGNGIRNAEVAVVAIDAKNSMLSCSSPIPKISQYHSFEFHNDHMLMWRYFGIGEGKRWNYTGVIFQPAVQIILPFSATSKHSLVNGKSKRPRMDRSINNLKFCPEVGCRHSFEDDKALEEHLLSGQHTKVSTKSLVDRAKQSYVNRMKSSFSESSLNVSTISISSSEEKHSLAVLNEFRNKGWALPVRRHFRYTEQQKKLLLEIFIAGEESGKKMNPDQVHQVLRRKLPPTAYVTSQQIRSLFSR